MVKTYRPAFAALAVVVLLLAGCHAGTDKATYDLQKNASFKIGDQWILKPPHEINATKVVVTRDIVDDASGKSKNWESIQQQLTIDLTTGRASLKDHDGRVYPQQIDLKVVRQIHQDMADRTWQIPPIKPVKKSQSVTLYQLQVMEAEQPYDSIARWATPAAKELPESLQRLVTTLDIAHRYAYPLSGEIDLLN